MTEPKSPIAQAANTVPPQTRKTNYPPPFAALVEGREKRRLGDAFGLKNFGVNLTRLTPGAVSALRHCHSRQDEFVYILEGAPVLVTDAGETPLRPGDCAGFKAGTGDAHHLVNRGTGDVVYLEIGDRGAGDTVSYPDDDLAVAFIDGRYRMQHKDGTPY
ncbi:MAG: cupin domain-containing protein [Stellaceae bacterium]